MKRTREIHRQFREVTESFEDRHAYAATAFGIVAIAVIMAGAWTACVLIGG